ncbi:15509_t:CDS:2, partial [Entrophospora sp. SA101]
ALLIWGNLANEANHTVTGAILSQKAAQFARRLDISDFKSSQYVEKNFSPHLIATGHYTEVVFNNEQYYLSKPKDKEKDQTYFLCQVNPMLFKKIIFLLANLTKQEVRQLALHLQLVNAKKKDSTGICFIGKRKFDKFLANYLTKSVGKIIDVDKKKIIGQHQGTPYYTIGQWRNLGLAGHCTPYYLVGKNDKKNLLYVSQGSDELEYELEYEENAVQTLINQMDVDDITASNYINIDSRIEIAE